MWLTVMNYDDDDNYDHGENDHGENDHGEASLIIMIMRNMPMFRF